MSQQMSLFQPQSWSAWTVTDITRYLKDLIESDHNLADLWVEGEISNVSRPRSGHLYFTIKDSNAALRVVMWRSSASRLRFQPRDGDAVEVHGHISIYEVGGQYQLYADHIRPIGEGALYQAFLHLKEKLEAEGLFDEGRKRPVPTRPKRIGIVTSPTGAALRDMLNTLRRRYPLVDVILVPTAVQGDQAPPGIVAGIEDLNRLANPDVILVARGGGSIEDLWAFNDERVARAIAASQAPVISGVGHQTDFTIADFVADLRAATPTAAAELVVPNKDKLVVVIRELRQKMAGSVLAGIQNRRWSLSDLSNRLNRASPDARIQRDRQRIDEYASRTYSALRSRLRLERTQVLGLEQRLNALNPEAVLGRGYAVVSGSDGEVIRRVAQASLGDRVNVRVSDGAFSAEVVGDD
jgi:exodeoxyribonuclease VII large subunit